MFEDKLELEERLFSRAAGGGGGGAGSRGSSLGFFSLRKVFLKFGRRDLSFFSFFGFSSSLSLVFRLGGLGGNTNPSISLECMESGRVFNAFFTSE